MIETRREFLKVLAVLGVGAVAPVTAAVVSVLPDKRLEPFTPKHPDFAKSGSMIRAQDFRDLAETVDALVERLR